MQTEIKQQTRQFLANKQTFAQQNANTNKSANKQTTNKQRRRILISISLSFACLLVSPVCKHCFAAKLECELNSQRLKAKKRSRQFEREKCKNRLKLREKRTTNRRSLTKLQAKQKIHSRAAVEFSTQVARTDKRSPVRVQVSRALCCAAYRRQSPPQTKRQQRTRHLLAKTASISQAAEVRRRVAALH